MRVLIVGFGYIGSALGAELSGRGHEVSAIRRNWIESRPVGPDDIKHFTADITDLVSLKALPASYDWVVVCAAATGGTSEDYRALYVQGMLNLLAWLSPAPQKIVYTSSTGVYGQDDGSIVEETGPACPETETGRILLAAENALRSSNLPGIILRVAGIYGPGRTYMLRRFLSRDALLDDEADRWMNMVHRDDVAGAIIAALEKGKPGETYNVVDDEPVAKRTLFEWLAAQDIGAFRGSRTEKSPPPSPKRGLTSKRVSNRNLKAALHYCFKFPTFREGYAALIRELTDSQTR